MVDFKKKPLPAKAGGKKTPGTAIVPWSEKFAAYAKDAIDSVKGIAGGGVGVKFGRGKITVAGLEVPGGKLNCVILGQCAMNAWYEAAYDPDDPEAPDCYAYALTGDDAEMAPHPDCANPQAKLCSECEKNVFGTATVGRGKACGNNVRIALITEGDAEDAESIGTAEVAAAKISPTNLKRYAGYVKAVAEEDGRPPWAVATEISSHDDPKTQIRVEFRKVDVIDDDDILDALEKKANPDKVQAILQVPFAVKTEKPAKKPAAGKSQKFAGGKRR